MFNYTITTDENGNYVYALIDSTESTPATQKTVSSALCVFDYDVTTDENGNYVYALIDSTESTPTAPAIDASMNYTITTDVCGNYVYILNSAKSPLDSTI
jgi:arginine repressor